MSSRAVHRYWLAPAFIALILAPAPLAAALLAAAVTLAAAFRVARWGAHRRERASAAGNAAVVLGVDRRGRPVLLTSRELSAHGLILGASGAGKSTTLLRILTEQIERGRPAIAIDLKGSPAFAQVLDAAAAAAGRPLALWSIDGPGHWNPLQHGNATELKDKLISTERFTEPHYQRAAERYVQTVLQVLDQVHPGRPPVLSEVVELMDPFRLPTQLRHVDWALRERVQDYVAGLTPDQLSAARGLQTRLAVLTESHTGPYLAPPADPGGHVIDLRRALGGSEVVLFSLNSSKYGRIAAQIGTLVVQDLVSASGDRLGHDATGIALDQAIIGIDEFSALGADHVIALLARGRESGMPVFVATQEMVDLDRAGLGLRDQVIGVTAVKIIHRQEVPQSAQMVAQMTGTEQVWEETRQTAARLLVGYETGRATKRQVERYIVHPNEIMTLPAGEAILISKMRARRPRTVRVQPSRPEPTRALARPRAEPTRAPAPTRRPPRDSLGR
jgi:conjugal transfer pilus assembly protein TraD